MANAHCHDGAYGVPWSNTKSILRITLGCRWSWGRRFQHSLFTCLSFTLSFLLLPFLSLYDDQTSSVLYKILQPPPITALYWAFLLKSLKRTVYILCFHYPIVSLILLMPLLSRFSSLTLLLILLHKRTTTDCLRIPLLSDIYFPSLAIKNAAAMKMFVDSLCAQVGHLFSEMNF